MSALFCLPRCEVGFQGASPRCIYEQTKHRLEQQPAALAKCNGSLANDAGDGQNTGRELWTFIQLPASADRLSRLTKRAPVSRGLPKVQKLFGCPSRSASHSNRRLRRSASYSSKYPPVISKLLAVPQKYKDRNALIMTLTFVGLILLIGVWAIVSPSSEKENSQPETLDPVAKGKS